MAIMYGLNIYFVLQFTFPQLIFRITVDGSNIFEGDSRAILDTGMEEIAVDNQTLVVINAKIGVTFKVGEYFFVDCDDYKSLPSIEFYLDDLKLTMKSLAYIILVSGI